MIARCIEVSGGGWIVRCDTHDWEAFAATRKAAEHAASKHNHTKHKEN